jgi:hypothetical protein
MLDPRLTHEALRTRIAMVRAAAHDGDRVRVRSELGRFVDALRAHLVCESSVLEILREPDARVVRGGHARILAAVTALVSDEVATDGSHVEGLASQLDALLELQDIVERRQFRLAPGAPQPDEMPVFAADVANAQTRS